MEITKVELVSENFRGGPRNVYRVYFTEDRGRPQGSNFKDAMLVLGIDELNAYQQIIKTRGAK